ncbi:MAG TPA: type II toxin-antitoxin system RelE/ParE family toxin [Ignavibacteria bacterium]|nr:type II toxin-antitoxin system RelE/ParE family toxin [Ignavibacteria bacterium]
MKVISSQKFEKDLNKFPKITIDRIITKIKDLETGKENLDIRKLKSGSDYRLRVGDYRIIFEYDKLENETVILLHTVIHRKDAYK